MLVRWLPCQGEVPAEVSVGVVEEGEAVGVVVVIKTPTTTTKIIVRQQVLPTQTQTKNLTREVPNTRTYLPKLHGPVLNIGNEVAKLLIVVTL